MNTHRIALPIRAFAALVVVGLIQSAALGQSTQGMTQNQQKSSEGSRTADNAYPGTVQAVAAGYQIQVGDVVSISVYQEPDLTTMVRVGDDGVIVIPLIGNTRIRGMSVSEVTRDVTNRLKDGYLVNPVVTVSLMEQAKYKFTILGQVNRPGVYELPFNGSIGIIEAIGLAGGFTRIASPTKITVKRGDREIIKVNAKEESSGDKRSVFRLIPGDVMVVPESLF